MFINHNRIIRARENKNKNIMIHKTCDSLEVLTRLNIFIFKFSKFELYELLKTLNQVSHLKMNVSHYVTSFPMKLKIVHIRIRKF